MLTFWVGEEGRQSCRWLLLRLDDRRRQACHRRILEEAGQRQVDSEGVAQLTDQLDRHQRVASELEEALRPAHPFEPQLLLPELGDPFLGLAPGGVARVLGLLGLEAHEVLTVDLAAARQRQRVEECEGRWHHVLGQARGQELAQLGRGGRGGTRDHASQQSLVSPQLSLRQDDHVAHGRMLLEGRFDLPWLDPEAAHLDLEIAAPEKLELAVRKIGGTIAGAVEALPGPIADRIGNEARRRPSRVTVAHRQTPTTDVEVAGHPDRTRARGGVEDMVASVTDRPAVGDAQPVRRHFAHRMEVRPDRGLGGSTQGDDAGVGEGGA